jgi:hypothetical protein
MAPALRRRVLAAEAAFLMTFACEAVFRLLALGRVVLDLYEGCMRGI